MLNQNEQTVLNEQTVPSEQPAKKKTEPVEKQKKKSQTCRSW